MFNINLDKVPVSGLAAIISVITSIIFPGILLSYLCSPIYFFSEHFFRVALLGCSFAGLTFLFHTLLVLMATYRTGKNDNPISCTVVGAMLNTLILAFVICLTYFTPLTIKWILGILVVIEGILLISMIVDVCRRSKI